MIWLLCHVLRWHVRPRHHQPAWSMYWCCERCGQMQRGKLAQRRYR